MIMKDVDKIVEECYLFMDMVELEKHILGEPYLQVYIPKDILFLLLHQEE